MRSVAFCTLGCKVNQYETDAMTESFARAGYEVRDFEQAADVYVVNTCTVTNIADRKSRQMLRRARKRNPNAVVVAAGCYVQAESLPPGSSRQEKDSLDDIVDIMIGNDMKGQIVEAVEEYLNGRENHYVLDISGSSGFEPLQISRISGHTRAYIKVQDGCNQFCSYCLIPYVRGRIRSRQIKDVLDEAKGLAAGGVREIVLTGIHISSYGLDWEHESSRGEEDYGKFGRSRLIDLIEALSAVEGIDRIRLSSLEPRIITEDFIRRLAAVPQICPHFHLSLQSGCDGTLARMNRHYTTEQYLESCRIIRRQFVHPAITTDVIAGFPGETEEEFAATCRFVQEVRFSDMHIFKYSRRKGTRAAGMPGQVDPAVQTLRSDRLLELASGMQKAFMRECIGCSEEVLAEESAVIHGKTYMTGYSKNYIRCAFPQEGVRPGQIVRVIMRECADEGTMLCSLQYD